MKIIHKCVICNGYVWPWQKVSATDFSGSHHSCHKTALDIDRLDPEMSKLLDKELLDFERKSGHSTGFIRQPKARKTDAANLAFIECPIERDIHIAEVMAITFPKQPSHKRHADDLRKIKEYHDKIMG